MATVQAYTKSGVDAKFNSRSNMTMVHNGGGSPDLSAYPDSKTGDVIERSSDGARWSVVASTINPIAGRVVSVAGKTGVVTLGPGDVKAAPASHTHTKAQITDLNASTSATANSIAQRGTGGVLVVGTPTATTHATTKAYVDGRITGGITWNNLSGKPSTVSNVSGSTSDSGSHLTLSPSGRLTAVDPSAATDVANKQYVDSEISSKTTWANTSGKPSTFPPSSHNHTVAQITDLTLSQTATGSSVVQRDSSGRATVATPTTTGHATTKAYVDNAVTAAKAWTAITGKPSTFAPSAHTHTKAQITDLNASTSATANSIAQRGTGGVLVVGTPTATTHATTKAYVDNKFDQSDLNRENLNDITNIGGYYQHVTSRVSTDSNYPPGAGIGILVVVGNSHSVKQEYTELNAEGMYYRTKLGSSGWTPWQLISHAPVGIM